MHKPTVAGRYVPNGIKALPNDIYDTMSAAVVLLLCDL